MESWEINKIQKVDADTFNLSAICTKNKIALPSKIMLIGLFMKRNCFLLPIVK
jgi:hypothetical protein